MLTVVKLLTRIIMYRVKRFNVDFDMSKEKTLGRIYLKTKVCDVIAQNESGLGTDKLL